MDLTAAEKRTRRNTVVKNLNTICRGYWTESEVKSGKVAKIDWEYRREVLQIVPEYEAQGWIVLHEVMLDKTGKTIIVRIKRPPAP